jgi:hypothetical protein
MKFLSFKEKERIVEHDMQIMFGANYISSNWVAMTNAASFGASSSSFTFTPHIDPHLRAIEKLYNKLPQIYQNTLYCVYGLTIHKPIIEIIFGPDLKNVVYMTSKVKSPKELEELCIKFHMGTTKQEERDKLTNKISEIRIEAQLLMIETINKYTTLKFKKNKND